MKTYSHLISQALTEDIGGGDHTSLSCIPSDAQGKAKLLVKQDGILAGLEVAKEVFRQVDNTMVIEELISDGEAINVGDIVFYVEGKSQSILQAERLALNFMQRMSGIATHTKFLRELIGACNTQLLDTRKTTPNNRIFEKMAVKIGGGVNHRFGLYDMVMIKDNHIDYAGGIEQAIRKTRDYLQQKGLDIKIEIEARDLIEVKTILAAEKVDRIMLDNFSYANLREAVALIGDYAETEASGGITEKTIGEYARCGVDFISVGALTHQIKSLDLSLKAID
ncbi:MAG: carboxylating nicotinate-nucleotide diphosphorylase [Flavobacteriales bacterium]|nr:carboxylating nicotinate-nucleotide diphosphorylase [Flavobacteriales bacterium]